MSVAKRPIPLLPSVRRATWQLTLRATDVAAGRAAYSRSSAVTRSISLPLCSAAPLVPPSRSEGHSFPLHAGAEVLVRLHTDRLALIRARLMRSTLFAPPMLSSVRKEYVALTPVAQVPQVTDDASGGDDDGSGAPLLTLLGTLTQPSEGCWCVEDESGVALVLDLSRITRNMAGMYTETSVVIVQGTYHGDTLVTRSLAGSVDDGNCSNSSSLGGASSLAAGAAAANRLVGSFRVRGLAHPPAEDRASTLRAMGVPDPLLVSITLGEVARERAVLQGSPEARNAMFVFAANVHLDSSAVMASLRRMLAGFAASPVVPALFVLMGNFTSRAFDESGAPHSRSALAGHFDALAALLGSFPEVASRSQFVLVPGPRDVGSAAGLLPRPPIPAALCGRLLDPALVPALSLATNPVRVRFLGQEIVVFRGDVTTPLQRRSVLPLHPPETSATDHMIRTVIDQGHLVPLPLSVKPIYWDYDHALRLSPTPDTLIIAEDRDPFVSTYNGCLVVNPGSLSSGGNFAVYTPVTSAKGGSGRHGPPSAEISRV